MIAELKTRTLFMGYFKFPNWDISFQILAIKSVSVNLYFPKYNSHDGLCDLVEKKVLHWKYV